MKYITLLFLSVACVPLVPVSNENRPELLYTNKDYRDAVGMVQLYPSGSNPSTYPVIPMGGPGMTLTFDLLEENLSYLNAKLIHCNSDWTKSNLSELQYISSFNEFPVEEYNYSANTRTAYVQYKISIPPPTKSGNYLMIVYRENDPQNLVLSRRMMVFEPKASIDAEVVISNLVSRRDENQQLEFDVKYGGISNPNPLRDFKVSILQNHNWHSAITNLRPTLLRSDENYIEYRHFNGENNFPGLNEFRFFDLRSVEFRRMNVERIIKSDTGIQAAIIPDKSRGGLAYAQLIDDLNGGFLLENSDPNETQLQSEYVNVHFELKTEEVVDDLYIMSQQNHFQYQRSNKMYFDNTTQSYKGQLLLKQGYYDYAYWTKDGNIHQMEGNHFQTNNNYEILIYYRDPSENYDELIGYKSFSSLEH